MVSMLHSAKRSLTVVVTLLVMVVLMIPFGAFSPAKAYGMAIAPADYVCSIGTQGYTDLGDALNAAQDGDTIKLLADIDYQSSITVQGMTLTFDTNGHVLNVIRTTDPNLYTSYALGVTNNGCVDLEDTSAAGSGQLNVIGGEGSYYTGLYIAGGSATVTNASGTSDGIMVDSLSGYPCTATILGDVTGYSEAISVMPDSSAPVTITVNGNVTSQLGGISITAISTHTDQQTSITVKGDLTASTEAVDVYNCGGSSQVTVDGTVTHGGDNGLLQVRTGFVNIPETYTVVSLYDGDGVAAADKPGYLEYRQDTAVVWVKSDVVPPAVLTGIELSTLPTKLACNVGDSLDLTGMTVTANYSDGSSQIVTGYTTDPAAGTPLDVAGTLPVLVSYQDMSTSFNITVRASKPVVGAPGSGDLFGTGEVTMDVAMDVAQIITGGGMDLNSAQFAAVDMDGDGVLTMHDVMLIMQKAAGL